MKARDVVRCRGSPTIRATHPSTFEVTRDRDLTPAGDCIIGICADKGASALDSRLKQVLVRDDAILITRLTAEDETVEVIAHGSSRFTLDHPTDLVWRRSTFVCGRTVGIGASHTARTLPRSLVTLLRQGCSLTVELIAVAPDSDD